MSITKPAAETGPYRVVASRDISVRLAGRRAILHGTLGWAIPAMAPPSGNHNHIAVKFDGVRHVVAVEPDSLSPAEEGLPISPSSQHAYPERGPLVIVHAAYRDGLGACERIASAPGATVYAAARADPAGVIALASAGSCVALLVGPPLRLRPGVPRRPVSVLHAISAEDALLRAEPFTFWDEVVVIQTDIPPRTLAAQLAGVIDQSAAFTLQSRTAKVSTQSPPIAVLMTLRTAGVDLSPPRALPPSGVPIARLLLRMKGVHAEGEVTRFGFRVLAGSGAVREETAQLSPPVAAVRRMLMQNGVIRDTSAALLFTRNAEFSSPSTAASVVAACAVNGYQAWKTVEGLPLRQILDSRRRATPT
jgi:hypothetical protein